MGDARKRFITSEDTKDLDWSRIGELTERIPGVPLTWEGFGQAWEVHRQVYVQKLSLPQSRDEWNHAIWVHLNQELIDLGERLALVLDRPEHSANLSACVDAARSDLLAATHPMSDEEYQRIAKALGFDEKSEDGPGDEADWWKRG